MANASVRDPGLKPSEHEQSGVMKWLYVGIALYHFSLTKIKNIVSIRNEEQNDGFGQKIMYYLQ